VLDHIGIVTEILGMGALVLRLRSSGMAFSRGRRRARPPPFPSGLIREGRVLSRSRQSKPSLMDRSCQRQTQVLDLPLRRMISFVPTPSALNRTISARQTCFCEALRFLMTAWTRRRSAGEPEMDFPVRIAQTRMRREKLESQKGFNRQISSMI